MPFVCAARISGAIRAMSGREFGADTTAPRRLFKSAARCRSAPSGSLKCRKRLMEALTHELTTAVALSRVSRWTGSLIALQRAASSRLLSPALRSGSGSEGDHLGEPPTTRDFAVPVTDIAALQPASVARCSRPRLRLEFSLVGDVLPPRYGSVFSRTASTATGANDVSVGRGHSTSSSHDQSTSEHSEQPSSGLTDDPSSADKLEMKLDCR